MTISIAGRKIGTNYEPFIIAEMSGNHNQSLDRAIEIVNAAANAGAHAIKLQTYTANTMTLNINSGSFQITDNDSLWKGSNLHALYEKAYTPWEWHMPIMERANQLGLICFSSPFDESAVDFLNDLNVPAFKIASFENNHLPLIAKAASTGKPIIISTGMATVGEIEQAVNTASQAGCKEIALLKCTSTYPASADNTNLSTIPHLKDLFKVEVGLSDHTMGIGVAVASIPLGASIIEKHFTLSRTDGGVDSTFSIEPHELSLLVTESKRAWEAIGQIKYGPSEQEIASTKYRRSIYVSKDIKIGDVFNSDNLKIIRPGDGAPPMLYPKLLGRCAKSNFKEGEPLTLDKIL